MARTYTQPEKADAVALYVEHGLAEAHHRTGIPKVNLKRWANTQGVDTAAIGERASAKTAAATQASQQRWADLRAAMADRSGDMATRVLAVCEQYLEELVPTSVRDLQSLATTFGILVDKAQVLSNGATERIEHVVPPERSPDVEEELAKLYDLAEHRAA